MGFFSFATVVGLMICVAIATFVIGGIISLTFSADDKDLLFKSTFIIAWVLACVLSGCALMNWHNIERRYKAITSIETEVEINE